MQPGQVQWLATVLINRQSFVRKLATPIICLPKVFISVADQLVQLCHLGKQAKYFPLPCFVKWQNKAAYCKVGLGGFSRVLYKHTYI